jgi:hypothetical protein
MLQHVIYVLVSRFLGIIRKGFYALCQFQGNPSQFLWILSQIFQVLSGGGRPINQDGPLYAM